jgi:hypothetical protein
MAANAYQTPNEIPTMAASVVDANDGHGPLPAQTTLLYIPDFLDGAMVDKVEETLKYKTIHKDLLQKDWITTGLSTEIHSLFVPTADKIDKSTGSPDLEAFKTKFRACLMQNVSVCFFNFTLNLN